jgi:hypothetical protein
MAAFCRAFTDYAVLPQKELVPLGQRVESLLGTEEGDLDASRLSGG